MAVGTGLSGGVAQAQPSRPATVLVIAGNAAGGAAVGVVGLGPAVAAAGGVILVSGVLVHLMPGVTFPAAAAQQLDADGLAG